MGGDAPAGARGAAPEGGSVTASLSGGGGGGQGRGRDVRKGLYWGHGAASALGREQRGRSVEGRCLLPSLPHNAQAERRANAFPL